MFSATDGDSCPPTILSDELLAVVLGKHQSPLLYGTYRDEPQRGDPAQEWATFEDLTAEFNAVAARKQSLGARNWDSLRSPLSPPVSPPGMPRAETAALDVEQIQAVASEISLLSEALGDEQPHSASSEARRDMRASLREVRRRRQPWRHGDIRGRARASAEPRDAARPRRRRPSCGNSSSGCSPPGRLRSGPPASRPAAPSRPAARRPTPAGRRSVNFEARLPPKLRMEFRTAGPPSWETWPASHPSTPTAPRRPATSPARTGGSEQELRSPSRPFVASVRPCPPPPPPPPPPVPYFGSVCVCVSLSLRVCDDDFNKELLPL
eukprot:SAG11_NODE_846_length_6884_cov_5.651732_2_plen_323_part_00